MEHSLLACFGGSKKHTTHYQLNFLFSAILFLAFTTIMHTTTHGQTVIFSEDFDNPSCSGSCSINGWTTPNYRSSSSSTDYELRTFATSLGFHNNGTQHSGFHEFQRDRTVWYYTPPFSVTAGRTYVVQLTHRKWRALGSGNLLTAHIGTNPTPNGMSTQVHAQTIPSTYTTESFQFTPTTTGPIYLGFRQVPQGLTDGYNMDDFSITELPACAAPTSLTATALSHSVVELNWTHNANNATSDYDIEYGPTGFTLGTGTSISATAATHTITGLNGSTSYEFIVTANCGGGNLSAPVTVSTTTLPSCFSPITPNASSIGHNSLVLSWTSAPRNSSADYQIMFGPQGFVPPNGTSVTTTDTFQVINGLSPNSPYDFYVRTHCGAGDYSSFSMTGAQTLFAPMPIPFIENFDGVAYNGIPTHWLRYDENGDYQGGFNRRWEAGSASWNSSGNNTIALSVSGIPDVIDQVDDWLVTPRLNLVAGQAYQIEFRYNGWLNDWLDTFTFLSTYLGNGNTPGSMQIELGQVIAFGGQPPSRTFRAVFTAPTYGSYHVGIHAHRATDFPMHTIATIDDFSIKPLSPAATGTVDATASETCITASGAYDFNASGFHAINDASGHLLALVNANGNDIGTVTAQAVDLVNNASLANGLSVLSRNLNLSSSIGPGPYTVNGGIKVMIPFTNAELNQLLSVIGGGTLSWSDLAISHYEDANGSTEDCDLMNNTASGYSTLALTNTLPYGTDAHLVEFTTQSFSEFSAGFSAPLPVELVSFEAYAKTGHNEIHWTTVSEVDASYFVVERSLDAEHFEQIATITARGAGDYSCDDHQSNSTTISYYRLRAVDIDGSQSLSDIVSVTRRDELYNHLRLTVYPNPTQETLAVTFNTKVKGTVELSISESTGRTLLQKTYEVEIGEHTRELDLRSLPEGLYTLQVSDTAGHIESRKIVRQ